MKLRDYLKSHYSNYLIIWFVNFSCQLTRYIFLNYSKRWCYFDLICIYNFAAFFDLTLFCGKFREFWSAALKCSLILQGLLATHFQHALDWCQGPQAQFLFHGDLWFHGEQAVPKYFQGVQPHVGTSIAATAVGTGNLEQ